MPFYGVFEVQACVFWYLPERLYCVFRVPLMPFYGVFEVQACKNQENPSDRKIKRDKTPQRSAGL